MKPLNILKKMDYINKIKIFYSQKRWEHISGMLETLELLKKKGIYLLNEHFLKKLRLAILLHDIGKKYDGLYKGKEYYPIYHAFLSYYFAKKIFHIFDTDLLNSIRFHTTGREKMSILEIFLFILDFCEITREFKEAAICRNLFFNGELFSALIYAGEVKIFYVKQKNQPLHLNTIRMVRYYEKMV